MSSTAQTMTGRLARLASTVGHSVRTHRDYLRELGRHAFEVGREYERLQWIGPQPLPSPRRHLALVRDGHGDTA